jgi:hypothetical protein
MFSNAGERARDVKDYYPKANRVRLRVAMAFLRGFDPD